MRADELIVEDVGVELVLEYYLLTGMGMVWSTKHGGALLVPSFGGIG